MNYHQELLKIVPTIFAKNKFVEIFNDMMVHSPNAILASYNNLYGGNKIEQRGLEELQKLIYDVTRYKYAFEDLTPIMNEYKRGKMIQAIKEIRHLSGMGLYDAKNNVNDKFKNLPFFNEIFEGKTS